MKRCGLKIAIIGECMIELSKQSETLYQMAFGGDTLNMAIYFSRCGGDCDYFTVLGRDPFSQNMVKKWQDEGIGVDEIRYIEQGMPGLYIIDNDDDGERSFYYWRNNSPARRLIADFPEVFNDLCNYPYIYLSGITLSLYSDKELVVLTTFLDKYRSLDGKVIFDNNFRPSCWESVSHAKAAYTKIMQQIDIALISYEDDVLLYKKHSIEECLKRWNDSSASEIVVKNGEHGCSLFKKGISYHIPLDVVVSPIDTTAAGDSFNGAYLASRLAGEDPIQAIASGQKCAANVILHKGAIVDQSVVLTEMPA